MTDPVLGLKMRRRIVAVVQEYPGLHLREVARQLDTSVALVEYHAAILLRAGVLSEQSDERYKRLYPARQSSSREQSTPSARDRPLLALLRERWPLGITLHLLDKGPQPHKQMCEDLGLGKSKLSFHLRKLEAAGIVAKSHDGRFRVLDEGVVHRILVAYPPTRDLRDEFANVWLTLYGD